MVIEPNMVFKVGMKTLPLVLRRYLLSTLYKINEQLVPGVFLSADALQDRTADAAYLCTGSMWST